MPEIGIADKTTLDAVNTKVGTNADAAGTSTLFARLAQIAEYTDTLETLIGTANPSSGDLTTLFKGLKLMETKVGLNTDGAGTSTVFARLAQIVGYVDTVESLIGTANPASGGTNTLFNYMKKIDDKSLVQTRQFYRTEVTIAPSSLTTVLDITGKGLLLGIVGFANSDSISYTYRIRLTIDGSVVSDGKCNTYNTPVYAGSTFWLYTDGTSSTLTTERAEAIPLLAEFNASLKIEASCSGGTSFKVAAVYTKQ